MGVAAIACVWISVLLGTLLGLMLTLISGAGKTVPGHPMNKIMAFGFDRVYGPFFGFPGTFLRYFIGISELIGSICLLIGLWGTALHKLSDEMDNLAQGLILIDASALGYMMLNAAVAHQALDGKPGFPAMLFVVCVLIVILRVCAFPPWETLTSENQSLVLFLGFCLPIPFVLVAFVSSRIGSATKDLESDNAALQVQMAQQ